MVKSGLPTVENIPAGVASPDNRMESGRSIGVIVAARGAQANVVGEGRERIRVKVLLRTALGGSGILVEISESNK